MKQVEKTLKKLNLDANKLPENLKERYYACAELMEKYNELSESYDEQEEQDIEIEKKLDDLDDEISTRDVELSDDIKEWHRNIENEEKDKRYEEEKRYEQEKRYRAFREPENVQIPEPLPATQKEKDNVGWLIFGGIVLAVTLGAVNVLKNK